MSVLDVGLTAATAAAAAAEARRARGTCWRPLTRPGAPTCSALWPGSLQMLLLWSVSSSRWPLRWRLLCSPRRAVTLLLTQSEVRTCRSVCRSVRSHRLGWAVLFCAWIFLLVCCCRVLYILCNDTCPECTHGEGLHPSLLPAALGCHFAVVCCALLLIQDWWVHATSHRMIPLRMTTAVLLSCGSALLQQSIS